MTQKEWEEGLKAKVKEERETIKAMDMLELEYDDSDVEEQTVTLKFNTMEWQSNQFSKIAGAVTAAIMETAIGTMANFIAGNSVTSDMQISYVSALNMGGKLTAKIYLVKAGGRVIRTRAELFDGQTGKLGATAVASSFRVYG